MPDRGQRWRLDGFVDRLDLWIDSEHPDDDLRLTVTDWIFSRFSDPYVGMRRAAGFANLWLGEVPGTRNGNHAVVVCSYWIEERDHRVRCDSIATLSSPV